MYSHIIVYTQIMATHSTTTRSLGIIKNIYYYIGNVHFLRVKQFLLHRLVYIYIYILLYFTESRSTSLRFD